MGYWLLPSLPRKAKRRKFDAIALCDHDVEVTLHCEMTSYHPFKHTRFPIAQPGALAASWLSPLSQRDVLTAEPLAKPAPSLYQCQKPPAEKTGPVHEAMRSHAPRSCTPQLH